MTRTVVPLVVPDLSGFTRALGRSLSEHQADKAALPSHQALLNLVARAAGHRNLQALRAAALATPRLAREPRPEAPPLNATVRKALMQFDGQGRLVRWPHKLSVQRLAMWVLWMQFDGRRVYTERQVNEVLKAWHTWGDHATLRRELVNHRLLARKSDCSEYRKLAVRADPDAQALMTAWRALVPQRAARAGGG